MRIHTLYLALTCLGIALPFAAGYNGLRSIDWDYTVALHDTLLFVTSVFGQVILIWLCVAGLALSLFVIHEATVRRDYYLLWALPVILVFSIGAALPFYLYLRAPKRDQ